MTKVRNAPPIRTAGVDDAAEIARLSAQLGYPASAGEFAARLAHLLAQPRQYAVFVADADERTSALLGYVAMERRYTLESGERTEIAALVVDTAARRRGVGEALVRAGEHWVRETGMTDVFVRSNVLRAESHPFYERAGYARTKTQHTYRKVL